jgi:peptide/nickel transport system ATP-binding protein
VSAAPPLLAVEDFSLAFTTRHGTVRALDRVRFAMAEGEMLGLVGESGSGKSVTAYAIAGLLEQTARPAGGAIRFRGHALRATGPAGAPTELGGRSIAMIFQNPRAALNPIRSVGSQIADVLRTHRGLGAKAAGSAAVDLLAAVRIADPARRARAYPFELSGGMCQRVMIALALACEPELLIADEPTTGLDVTTQAAIMDMLRGLAQARGMATLFITHDLSLAAEYCDRIAVMHAGQIVEIAPTAVLFTAPRHPYTRLLIAATPRPESRLETIATVPGTLPDLTRGDLPPCRFAERCANRETACDAAAPVPREITDGHVVACRRAS